MRLNLKGFVAATFTAFGSDGELNLPQIERQAEALHRSGVIGAFICGTTGEGQSLSSDERRKVAQRWCDVAPKGFTVIVHVGHVSLTEARSLAEHAAKAGAAGIAAAPPYFFKNLSVDDIIACSAQVAGAAPDLPFYYYHFPLMTGAAISAPQYLQKASERIPNLGGLKFTDDNLTDFGRCVNLFGDRMDLFLGREGMILPSLTISGRCAIGSSVNFAAPIYHRIVKAFESGNLDAARSAQFQAIRMLAVLAKFGGLRAMKAAMNLLGPDCGPVRLPLRPLDQTEQKALRDELDAAGFFELTRSEAPAGR